MDSKTPITNTIIQAEALKSEADSLLKEILGAIRKLKSQNIDPQSEEYTKQVQDKFGPCLRKYYNSMIYLR